jgi:hypothetical protein
MEPKELYNCICTVCQEQFQSPNKKSFTCPKCCPVKPKNKNWKRFEETFRMRFESKFCHDTKLMDDILKMTKEEIFLK